MSTYNINLPAATSFGITNIYNNIPPTSNDEPNAVTVNVSNPDNGFSFVQNVLQTLHEVTAVNPDAETATETTTTSNSNPIQALQVFLYDLNQALNGGAALPQTKSDDSSVENTELTTDSATDENAVLETPTSEINVAYSNPATNLQNLINSLGNETEQNSLLQADFTNLVQSLGSNAPVTLQDFLTQLAVKVGNGEVLQSNLGNLFTATA
jgi:hypothetical protein